MVACAEDQDRRGEKRPTSVTTHGTRGRRALGFRGPSGRGGDECGDGATKARKRARVTIDGIGTDREFDSFDSSSMTKPALAAMVIAVVTVVFFAPVLAIALILLYRSARARMLNETMLKLAERGIVPSAKRSTRLAAASSPRQ
jgi:hypothetical protein